MRTLDARGRRFTASRAALWILVALALAAPGAGHPGVSSAAEAPDETAPTSAGAPADAGRDSAGFPSPAGGSLHAEKRAGASVKSGHWRDGARPGRRQPAFGLRP